MLMVYVVGTCELCFKGGLQLVCELTRIAELKQMRQTYPGCMSDEAFHDRIGKEFKEVERKGGEDLQYYLDRSAQTMFKAKENRKRKQMLPLINIALDGLYKIWFSILPDRIKDQWNPMESITEYLKLNP